MGGGGINEALTMGLLLAKPADEFENGSLIGEACCGKGVEPEKGLGGIAEDSAKFLLLGLARGKGSGGILWWVIETEWCSL